MNLEIPNPNGLPLEGQKQNQTPLDQPMPKPEIKITKPEIVSQMPGPMPLSLKLQLKWTSGLQCVYPQNAVQQEFVELST